MGKTQCGVPPAAQTTAKRRSEASTKVRIGRAWATGATPPIAKPACSRTNSGVARSIGARLVDAPVAGGDDQHRATTGDGAKDQRLGDLTDRDAERIGRLLGGARRHRQFDDLHGHAGGQQRRLHPLRGSRERPAGSLAHTVRPPATSITAPLM